MFTSHFDQPSANYSTPSLSAHLGEGESDRKVNYTQAAKAAATFIYTLLYNTSTRVVELSGISVSSSDPCKPVIGQNPPPRDSALFLQGLAVLRSLNVEWIDDAQLEVNSL